MQIIKKKINLNQFKSWLPINILPSYSAIEGEDEVVSGITNTWGRIPCLLNFKGQEVRYGTLIDFYYQVINILQKCTFKEFDVYVEPNGKWLDIEYIWTDLLCVNTRPYIMSKEEPYVGISDRTLFSPVTDKELEVFKKIQDTFVGGNSAYTPVQFLKDVNEYLGIIYVPSNIEGIYVPRVVYQNYTGSNNNSSGVNDLITKLTTMRDATGDNCCKLANYEDYGGDTFLSFLQSISSHSGHTINPNITIDIPLLLTSDYKDLGLFKTSDVEVEIENHQTSVITGVTGESKLKTLKKRKISLDDNNEEIPGIYSYGETELELPFKVGYIKNIQIINNTYYGDTIYSIDKDDNNITFVYVLGGRLERLNNYLRLDEESPYDLTDEEITAGAWDGEGIWYKETYPYEELTSQFLIDGELVECTYDYIDFDSVATTYEFEGIDFPRKNYIFCEDIRYKSNVSSDVLTSYIVFRDEKMIGMTEKMKEKYNVIIDRGSSAAFERHLVLSEVKSFQDLELLRNNMFNI
jgi:hypothetical protein